MRKFVFVYFVSFFILITAFISAEELVLICHNYSPQNSIYNNISELSDSLTENYMNIFEISPFPFKEQNNNQICFLNPSIFSDNSFNFTQKILSTNVQCSDSSLFDLIPYKPVMLDTHSVVFLSITTPDFPILYQNYSEDFDVEIDLFNKMKEICNMCEKFGIDYIIAINYLGDFLSNELLQKVSQLDLVIDYFSLDNTHHYMKEITHPRLINWSRKKEQFLLVEIELLDDKLKIQDITHIE
ncbi:MAG: hypothetical protein JW794_09955 [Candidatus Cloacimonetes bacterium]|nr:hypothetical protein [Candidatus Cloacimonadota bacterium]